MSNYIEEINGNALSFRQIPGNPCATILVFIGLERCVAMENQNKDMSADKQTDKQTDKGYRFNRLPENIRQMGEQPEKNRVYIEDYVVTYIHQVFRKKQDKALVILVGKRGEDKARDVGFIYGAIEVELDILKENHNFNSEKWQEIYELGSKHFPGAEVLGWGCGVSLWNSHMDNAIRQIQKKHFSQEGKIFFMEDLGEKEEKVFRWENGELKELPGYMIYYEKNPQMQEFMLRGQPKKSFESTYQDKVTANVRTVIQRNGVQKDTKKLAMYSVGVLLAVLALLGANLLIQSTKKIDSLEKTIETLSNAATNVTEKPDDEKETDKPADGKETKKQEDIEETDKKKLEEALKPTLQPTAIPQKSPVVKQTQAPEKSTAVPSPEPKTTKKPKPVSKPVVMSSYIVQEGDTLSQIVWRQYHTLAYLEKVKKKNNIKDGDKIRQGQRILLPDYAEEERQKKK